MYEMTGDETLKKLALENTDRLINYSGIDYTHDMGFIFLPTAVKAYEHTGEEKYKEAAIKAARMLAKRYNKNGHFIKAWGKLGDEKKAGWVIIDTMMNLELLFWAARETGDSELYDIAYRHAIMTMNNHVRKNYSSYHVVEYNPKSGEVEKKRTHQGIEDESTWARGQAWGIAGFAKAYRYTGDERFLMISQNMADYFIDRLPNDFVPYWDLDLSGDDVVRDASAAAIAAHGMFLLADLSGGKKDSEKYRQTAEKITESLLQNYLYTNSKRETEEGILLHTVYNYHKDWGIDESFPCGDYYLIRATKDLWNSGEISRKIDSINTRTKININDDWFYLEDNIKELDNLYQSEVEWKKIDLPHTWNNFDAVDAEPGYRRSASWYQKNIDLPALEKNKTVKLYFEGVNIVSEIFVNGQKAGGHIGGYVGFEIDITPFLKKGGNTILVRADNSYNPDVIPSQKSDFFIYGGIFRDVYLKILPDYFVENLKITPSEVSANSANTEFTFSINGVGEDSGDLIAEAEILNPSGKKVLSAKKEFSSSSKKNIEINFEELKSPKLWSPKEPNLYTLNLRLNKDGKMIDEISETFGYRWFEFKDHGAFYLNGERLLLRGTHRHEDYAGLGNALPDSLHRKEMEMIKEMGANFVRLAHYPQDPEVYKACNELGLLVWDELPWCRGGMGGEVWKENTSRLLREMIDQNYNHPAIIIWSLGNEIYWLPDFPGGGDVDSLRNFLSELNDIAHEKDPSRVTAVRKFYEGADIVDVFSPSIWSGWYSGVYKNYADAIEDAQKKYDKLFHAEYGGSSHLGRHTETPITGDGFVNPDEWEEKVNQVEVKNVARMGDWSENYIVDLFDWHLRYSEQTETFPGNAQWAFKDFGTPLRPENAIPYINQKGLVDREGNPKDAYYVFKSYWTDDPKFCYIESHTWLERNGPEGEEREVNVYSNCEEVELFVNGKSQGKYKKDISVFPASGLSWQVNFAKGKNIIKAIGFDNGESAAADEIEISYSTTKNGKPEKIILSSEKLASGNFLITAVMEDGNGNRCLDYNDFVFFSMDGDGKLLEDYGTPTKSSVIQMANGKAEIEFVPVPFGNAVVEARNQDFKGSYIQLQN